MSQNSLPFLRLAVFLWRHSHQLAEQAGEVIGILNPYLVTDLVDLHVRVIQQEAGLLDFQQIEVSERRMSRLFFEKQGEMRGRIVHVRGHVLQSKVLLQVFFHIMYGDGHHVEVIHGTRIGLAELLEIAQGAEVIVEKGGHIVQVLLAVSRLQGVEHLLEKGVAVADARVLLGQDVQRCQSAFGIIGCQSALEVNPVNRPRFFVIGGIDMGNAGREDEILVGRDGIHIPAHLIASCPLRAIDEDILVDGLLALAEVMFRLGVKANVRDVQHGSQRVVFHHLDNDLGKHQSPFAAESVFQSDHGECSFKGLSATNISVFFGIEMKKDEKSRSCAGYFNKIVHLLREILHFPASVKALPLQHQTSII